MEFKIYSFNSALENINESSLKKNICNEVFNIIKSITDKELMDYFSIYSSKIKSLSKIIKMLMKEKLMKNNWIKNQNMFLNDNYYNSKRFSYDYYKSKVNLEFAFNHESASAWILLKGILCENGELKNEVNTEISLIITADKRMKSYGGFDGSIGTYEKYIDYLNTMKHILKKPIILIGLEPLSDFVVKHRKILNKKIAIIKEMK